MDAIKAAEGILSSARYADQDVSSVELDASIAKLRSFVAKADMYYKATRAYLVKAAIACTRDLVSKCDELCPKWSVWAKDSEYDRDKLSDYSRSFKKDAVKKLMQELYSCLQRTVLFASELGVSQKLNAWEETKDEAVKVAETIQYAKNSVALHTSSVYLERQKAGSKVKASDVSATLEGFGKVKAVIPASVQEALKLIK